MANPNLLEENILSLLGLESLPEEEKKAILLKMADVLRKRVMVRVIEQLDEKDEEKLATIGDQPEEVIKYLAERIPDFDKIMEEETIKLKEEMSNVAEQAI